MAATEALAGRKVLLVEDDFFIADEIVRTLAEGGADVVGPAVSVQGALELIDQSAPLDGAVLDVNLNGEKVYPVARRWRRTDKRSRSLKPSAPSLKAFSAFRRQYLRREGLRCPAWPARAGARARGLREGRHVRLHQARPRRP